MGRRAAKTLIAPVSPPMNRRLASVAMALSMSAACSGPEEEVLDRFLSASQRGDNETVAALSMVSFPDEIVSWNVLEIGSERREPYRVPELRQRVDDAEDARDAQFAIFGEFRRDNYDALSRIGARLRDEPDYHFPGRLGELQDEWEAFREERRGVVAKLHEAEIALERELRQVNKSIARESDPLYLTGETRRKDARVRVTTPAGDQHYTITLTRYELRNQFDALVRARWIITGVTKQ